MKHFHFLVAAFVFALLPSCKAGDSSVEIFPVQDNPAPRKMPRMLFSDAPDSLMVSLGLEDGVPSSVCAFLVRTQGCEILFDAANGSEDSRLMGVLDSLAVRPEDIDFIFLTHLHGDHIGGLLCNGQAAFPEAQVYVNSLEYDAWMNMPENMSAPSRKIADVYGERLHRFSIEDDLPCGITAVEAYGHTPGHTLYMIGNVLIAGDIMHGVALQKEYPEYCASFDMDKEKAVRSRLSVLDMAEQGNVKVYGMHFPAPYHL